MAINESVLTVEASKTSTSSKSAAQASNASMDNSSTTSQLLKTANSGNVANTTAAQMLIISSTDTPPLSDVVSSAMATPVRTERIRWGKWTREEEAYTNRLIADFSSGLLTDVDNGTTMRSWLSKKLKCCPMRISKKFVGEHSIGKRMFERNDIRIAEMSQEEKHRRDVEVQSLYNDFVASWVREENERGENSSKQVTNGTSLSASRKRKRSKRATKDTQYEPNTCVSPIIATLSGARGSEAEAKIGTHTVDYYRNSKLLQTDKPSYNTIARRNELQFGRNLRYSQSLQKQMEPSRREEGEVSPIRSSYSSFPQSNSSAPRNSNANKTVITTSVNHFPNNTTRSYKVSYGKEEYLENEDVNPLSTHSSYHSMNSNVGVIDALDPFSQVKVSDFSPVELALIHRDFELQTTNELDESAMDEFISWMPDTFAYCEGIETSTQGLVPVENSTLLMSDSSSRFCGFESETVVSPTSVMDIYGDSLWSMTSTCDQSDMFLNANAVIGVHDPFTWPGM